MKKLSLLEKMTIAAALLFMVAIIGACHVLVQLSRAFQR
jgi:hypothetical protein